VSYLEIGFVEMPLNYFGVGIACSVMMHPARIGYFGKCLERLSRVRRQQILNLDFSVSSKGFCAGNTPMDSTSIADVRTGVVSIIQEFAEAYELFKKWRKGRAGKKSVGQEECETSLHEGKTTIEGTFNRFSLQHGARFDCGDSKDSPARAAGDALMP
jgi:hypothetical protein